MRLTMMERGYVTGDWTEYTGWMGNWKELESVKDEVIR